MKYSFSFYLSLISFSLLAHDTSHHMCNSDQAHEITHDESCHHHLEENTDAHKHEHKDAFNHLVTPNKTHDHSSTKPCNHNHLNESVTHESHDHEHDAPCGDNHTDDNHAHNIKSVDVAFDVQRVIGIKTQRVEKKVLSNTIPLHGRFEVNPDAQSVIVAPITGRLTMLKKTFDYTHIGEPLFTIHSPELITRWNEIELLKARLQTYQNAKIANVELDNQLKLKMCEWEALVGGMEVNNGVLIVKSTINGRIEERLINDGAWCELGTEVLSLKATLPLRFKSLIPASDAQLLSDGMIVNYQGEQGVLSMGMRAENGLMPLFVTFKNQPFEASPGKYALMECSLESSEKQQIVIPKTALIRVGINPTVFIRDPHNPERFIAQTVKPGISKSPWIAIEGLPSLDVEVVVSGQYELKLALPSNKEKAVGHFHADGSFHTEEH